MNLPVPVALLSKLASESEGKMHNKMDSLKAINQSGTLNMETFIKVPTQMSEEVLGMKMMYTVYEEGTEIPLCPGGQEKERCLPCGVC